MRRSFRALITVSLCLAISATATPAFAAAGHLDPSFSRDGVKVVDYSGSSENFYGTGVHGNAPIACGYSDGLATLTAFTAGGALDRSFSGDGKWRKDILGHGTSYLEACRSLPDGRIIAVGGAHAADGYDRMIVVVLHPNGTFDKQFSGDGVAVVAFNGIQRSDAYDLAIQQDGKIVVIGEGYDNSVSPATGFFEVARLNRGGSLDKTFSGDGRAKVDFGANDEGAWKVQLLHNGTIVLAGWVRNASDTEWNTALAELTPRGALVKTFSGDGMATLNILPGADDYALGLGVRSNDALVLGIYGSDGSVYKPRIAQVKPSGRLDGSFANGGVKAGFASGMSLQDLLLMGDKIVIAGAVGSTVTVMRLRSGGAADRTFGSHGVAALHGRSGYLFDIARDANGRIVGSGYTGSDGLVLRVLT